MTMTGNVSWASLLMLIGARVNVIATGVTRTLEFSTIGAGLRRDRIDDHLVHFRTQVPPASAAVFWFRLSIFVQPDLIKSFVRLS